MNFYLLPMHNGRNFGCGVYKAAVAKSCRGDRQNTNTKLSLLWPGRSFRLVSRKRYLRNYHLHYLLTLFYYPLLVYRRGLSMEVSSIFGTVTRYSRCFFLRSQSLPIDREIKHRTKLKHMLWCWNDAYLNVFNVLILYLPKHPVSSSQKGV